MVIIKNINNKIQKKRFNYSTKKYNIKFGDYSFCCSNEGRIELVHLNIFKKKLKNFIIKKNNKLNYIREKIWYFGRFNFFLQKKSKNSRMGKGKGSIERKIMRVRKNFIIFEFKGVNYVKLIKLLKFFNKISSVKFYVNKKKSKNLSVNNSKKYSIYFDKYLY